MSAVLSIHTESHVDQDGQSWDTIYVYDLEFRTDRDPRDRTDIEVVWDHTEEDWVLVVPVLPSWADGDPYMAALGAYGLVGDLNFLQQTRKI